jgi:hypothetical protein
MAFTVTPARRRLAMAAVLTLAVAGGIIRSLAPDPSTMRDVGTLLLVLWLPAIGNFIAYLSAKLPKPAPPPTGFPAGQAFSPQLRVQLERIPLPADSAQSFLPDQLGTVLVGRRGFTARGAGPMAAWVAGEGDSTLSLELLRPAAARAYLTEGTGFHLLVGTQAVAKGRVLGWLLD